MKQINKPMPIICLLLTYLKFHLFCYVLITIWGINIIKLNGQKNDEDADKKKLLFRDLNLYDMNSELMARCHVVHAWT